MTHSLRLKSALAGAAVIAISLTAAFATTAQARSLEQIKKSGTIRIAVANEIPYGFMQGDTAVGLGPSVAKPVLKKMGIDHIKWQVLPFGSLIPALKAGRVDMVAASQAIQPQRCTQVNFSTPNSTYGEGIMVKKGNPKDIHGYGAFVKNPNLKFGLVSGADELQFAQKLGIKSNQIVSLRANSDAISALTSGRIDGYAATQLTVEQLAKKSPRVEQALPFTDPIIDGKTTRSWGAFTFAKNDDSLLKAFNSELSSYQKTQAWHATMKKYGLDKESIDKVSQKTTQQLCSQNS